ncbi:DUF2852 domain-containing protein [Allorhizobium undicola]|uniref:DUF2852 domain-containing protein n=1 Tax=Allorhizobium undicola TaxID=78527 RepID=UPI00047F6F57|nr:DUF2852 domain-containing protein [Allorhizobium undicola]
MNQSALLRPAWTPATVALMVLGFMVFWPLGLAMLAYILFGDRFETFKKSANEAADGMREKCRGFKMGSAARWPQSGNVAFDDWRRAELERIEEERRKLDAMREEFESYMRELRRARDQEEFDRFLRERSVRQSGQTGPSDQN